MGAAASAPDLNDPWRAYFTGLRADLERAPDPELALILALAMDGLFWLETMGLARVRDGERAALMERMRALVDAMEGAE